MVLLIGSVTPGTLVGKDTVRTVLILQRARKQDSGNYTCAVADIAEATVTVHILNGELEHQREERTCVDMLKSRCRHRRRDLRTAALCLGRI
jgi:hypothetical protein